MNSDKVLASAQATLEGSVPFPQIVSNLIANGVEYYYVDCASKSFTFYSAAGTAVHAPLSLEGLPLIAENFDVVELGAANLDSQQNGQKFRLFRQRAMNAGVQGSLAPYKAAHASGSKVDSPEGLSLVSDWGNKGTRFPITLTASSA
jgi:hypothetical protein